MRLFRHTLALALVVAFFSILSPAQTLTPVYQYQFNGTGSDGGNPQDQVIQASDGNLYSTSYNGGDNGMGSVLLITPAGNASLFFECNAAGSDCSGLNRMIQLPDGNFWGVSSGTGVSGANQYGNIFKLTLGGVLTSEYSFVSDQYGAYPNSNIVYVESCDCIYGTTVGTNAVDGTGGTAPFGTVYSYHVGLVSGTRGMTHAYDFGNSGSNIALGIQPVDGVTVVSGKVYGTSQVGLNTATQSGVLWSFDAALSTGTVLHTFTDGLDGEYPSAPPRYYRPDGNIYGTTLQNDDTQADSGSIYKSSLTGTFAPVFTFTNTAVNNFHGAPAFDTAGNLIVTAARAGSDANGALYLEPRSGGSNITTLFTFMTGSVEGDRPQAAPFFDNTGKLWTVEFGGGTNLLGTIDEWTLSTETAAPIKISVSPTTADANESVTVTWSASNAFSDEEEVCWASGGNTNFQGVQTGTYASGVYSGSKTFSAGATAGKQALTIVCGGTESASTTLTVGSGGGTVATTTTLTASPNPVNAGNNVTLTATVKKSSGSGVPTGSVVFKTGTTVIDTITVNGGGVASLVLGTTGFPTGTYPITASYSGDSSDQASSGSTNLSVVSSGPVATTTTLVVSPNPVTVGTSINMTATVKRNSGSGIPSGTFMYKFGTTVLTTVTVTAQGVDDYQISTAGLPIGSYPITVTYSGDADDLTSTSNTVSVNVIKKTTTTTLAINPNPVKMGTNVTFTATVTPSTGLATGTVNFMLGTSVLSTVTVSNNKAAITYPTSGVPTGAYVITAVYSGDADDNSSTSARTTVTVN